MYFKLYKDLVQRYCFLHTYSIYCITIRNDDDKKKTKYREVLDGCIIRMEEAGLHKRCGMCSSNQCIFIHLHCSQRNILKN